MNEYSQQSVKALVVRLVDDINNLIRQEMRLARAEGSEKLSEATAGLVGIVAGLLIAFCALLVLVQAIVVALAKYMPASLASLIVGLVLALIAFVLVWRSKKALSATNLAFPRTSTALRRDKDVVMETVR